MKCIYLHIIFLLSSLSIIGQNIELIVPPTIEENYRFGAAISMDHQGEWAVIGSPLDSDLFSTGGSIEILRKVDNQWTLPFHLIPSDMSLFDNFGHAVAISGNGNFIVASSFFSDSNGLDSGSAYVFARQGGTWIEQVKLIPSDGAALDGFGQSIAINEQGNVIIIGAHQNDDNGPESGSAYIFTRDGDTWTETTKLIPTNGNDNEQFGFDVAINDSGNRVAVGSFMTTGIGKVHVFDFDSQNDIWSETNIPHPLDTPIDTWFGRNLDLDGSGDRLAISSPFDASGVGAFYVYDFDGNNWNQIQKLTPDGVADTELMGFDIAISNDGTQVVVGAPDAEDNGPQSGAIYRFGWDGSLWQQSNRYVPNSTTNNDQFGKVVAVDASGLNIMGGAPDDDLNGTLSGTVYYIADSDLLFITGNLIADTNDNCITDGSDFQVPRWLIAFDNGTDIFYSVTQPDGTFSQALLPLGNYDVYPIIPNRYWEVCSAPLNVSNVQGPDNISLDDIIIQPIVNCPNLVVGINAHHLKRCFDSQYVVHYQNTGTDSAQNANIVVELDSFLTYTNSSITPISQDGSTLTFDLGDLGLFESGNFTIDVEVSCDATLGQTHCTKATINPNNYCFPAWNGSRIEVEEVCTGTTLEYTIRNIGVGNMIVPSKAQIIEDMIMRVDQDYLVDPGNEETIIFDVSGGTVNFQTYQEAGYPFPDSLISITNEGCGADIPNMLGIFGEFPDYDDHPYISLDCQPNVGSFDPNDKQAFPVGYEADHLITDHYDLEYKIRFQNTGTDTAYEVVILDTLSEFLDPTSIVLESWSHPFEFSIIDGHIIQFSFDNIMLPDSASNPILSQGFVQFTISQIEGNIPGTVILNDASIYFDYNAPIHTNEVFHTIAEDYILVDLIDHVYHLDKMIDIKIGPNPFHQELLIHWEQTPYHRLQFQILDIQGKSIARHNLSQGNNIIHLPQLSTGTYIYQILDGNTLVQTGKLIAH